MEDHMTSNSIRFHGSKSSETQVPLRENPDVNISDINIILVCNDDLPFATEIVNQLLKQGATKIRLCYPQDQVKVCIPYRNSLDWEI
jgi:hypothetical protein